MTGVPSAITALTGVAPHFSAATTPATRGSDGNLQRNRYTNAGLATRQVDYGGERVDASIRFDECMADSLDFVAHCRKVDCHFVGKRACDLTIKRA
jgi:hypothetical protein